MKKQLPGWAVLLIITLIAGIALGATYALTKDPIAEQSRIQAENARKAALPDADSFEELPLVDGASVDWAYAGLKNGEAIGYVAQKTVNGFGGEVEVIAGVDSRDMNALKLGGISVGGSNFSETAGLGARSRDKAFTDQFIGKSVPVRYIKSGEEASDDTIDALTSATITTTAVVNGVNDIVKYIKAEALGIAGVEMPDRPADDQVFSSSAQGFRGPVYVEAAFQNGGEITYISVGDEAFAEDIGIGAKEPEFMIQFIGKSAPVDISDVDALAGATITTKAVISALNQAYELSQGGEIAVPETPVMPEKPEDSQVYGATADGFRGPVYVEAAFGENGEVTYLSVGDESFAEDIGIGAKDPEFMIQFIGKSLPVSLSDVDALTGATITTNAVISALNAAYDQYQGAAEETAATEIPASTEAPQPTQAPQPTAAPAPTVRATVDSTGSSASGEALMFFDEIRALARFEGDTLQDFELLHRAVGADTWEPMDEEQAYLEELVGKAMPLTDKDVTAGSEYMNQAVRIALNQAYANDQGGLGDGDFPIVFYSGEALVFFDVIHAEAAFEDDTVAVVKLSRRAVGETEETALNLEEAYQALLTGTQLPLDAGTLRVDGDTEYISVAVAVAVNQAYEQSLDRQQ